MRVKLQFIFSVAGQVTIWKEFPLIYFLSNLNSRSNKITKDIKKNIIKQFQILEKEALIKSDITNTLSKKMIIVKLLQSKNLILHKLIKLK